MFVIRYIIPCVLFLAWLGWFGYLSYSVALFQRTDFAGDARYAAALQCTPENVMQANTLNDAWWQELHARVGEDGNLLPEIYTLAEADDTDAQIMLGFHLLSTSAARNDQLEGIAWLQRAAEQNTLLAVSELGYGYLHGEYGLERDLDRAEAFLVRAEAMGDPLASYNLAELARRRDIFHYLDLNQSPQDTYIDALLTSAGHCYYGGLEALANEIDRGVSMPIDKDAANSLRRVVWNYRNL